MSFFFVPIKKVPFGLLRRLLRGPFLLYARLVLFLTKLLGVLISPTSSVSGFCLWIAHVLNTSLSICLDKVYNYNEVEIRLYTARNTYTVEGLTYLSPSVA